jgi:hypothetical protein
MKRIAYLCLILLCSVSFVFVQISKGQTRRKRPAVKKLDPQIAEAEKSWKIFFPKFQKAVKTRNYDLVKEMLVENIFCGVKENYDDSFEGKDLRDVCINYWREESEDLKWKDLEVVLFRFVQPIEKYDRIVRDVSLAKIIDNCSSNDVFAGFVFHQNTWYLEKFQHAECAD